jgi:hypothetical protein
MMRFTFHPLAVSLSVIGLAITGCVGSSIPGVDRSEPGGAAITLPPAWTDTPSPTVTLPTETPTATPLPTEAPRQLQTTQGLLLPTARVLSLKGAPPDRTGMKRIDVKSAYFFVPESYQVIEMGEMGEAMILLMQVFAQGMIDAFSSLVTPAPGETPTPILLDEMSTSLQFDLLMAADSDGRSAVFLVGEPLPTGMDLQSMLLKAIEDNPKDVLVERTELVYGGRYPMARALLQVRDIETGQRSRQALYLIAGHDRLWTLSYQSDPGQFEDLLPVFERSALSLQAE